jgi:glycine betaine transporter
MNDKTDKTPPSAQSFIGKHGLFMISLAVSVVVAVWGVFAPEDLGGTANDITTAALESLDWFFLAAVTGFVVLCIALAISPYGNVKLGKDDEEPEFGMASWVAMLFAAGMGVGLLFWGVSEPVRHFVEPAGLESQTPAAARQAMVLTSFHWGLHAWAIYAVTALVLAYFGFRKGARYLPGEPLRRVFKGSWVQSVSTAADIVGVLAVSLGVAGSLGLGLMQIKAGVAIVGGLSGESVWMPLLILGCLVAAYMTSATTGLSKGIRLLSNVNMWLAVLLMLFVLLAGPTVSLFGGFLTAVGDYSSSLVGISLRLFPYQDLQEWTHRWTLTFFIFWIAWAPFVGVFIARISRGRTIRQFVLGVLLIPTVFSLLWFAVFGGSGIYEEMHGMGGMAALVKEDMTVALFTLFNRLPLSHLLSVTAILLIFIFLVTSADSATFVLGMLTTNGNPNPPTGRKILWGLVLGALGAALMFTGSVEALQAVVVAGAIPFIFVMLLQVAALMKELRNEPLAARARKTKGTTGKKRVRRERRLNAELLRKAEERKREAQKKLEREKEHQRERKRREKKEKSALERLEEGLAEEERKRRREKKEKSALERREEELGTKEHHRRRQDRREEREEGRDEERDERERERESRRRRELRRLRELEDLDDDLDDDLDELDDDLDEDRDDLDDERDADRAYRVKRRRAKRRSTKATSGKSKSKKTTSGKSKSSKRTKRGKDHR